MLGIEKTTAKGAFGAAGSLCLSLLLLACASAPVETEAMAQEEGVVAQEVAAEQHGASAVPGDESAGDSVTGAEEASAAADMASSDPVDEPVGAPAAPPEGIEKSLAEALAELKAAPLEEGWEEEAEAARARQEPPSGVWWIDESGQLYFLSRYAKAAGYQPQMIPRPSAERMVELVDGNAFLVAGEDEDFLYLKHYRTSDPVERRDVQAEKNSELERISASYAVETVEVDRLRLEPFSQGLPTRGQWRNGFDIADMNGDGKLDIVHGPPRKGQLDGPRIFLGDGQGNWRFQAMEFPRFPFDYGDVAVADFNGDGLPDIALGAHLRGVMAMVAESPGKYRLWNEGMEYFSPRPDDAVGSEAAVFSSRTLTTGDWNGDGRIDVIGVGEGPRPAADILERTRRLFDRTSYGIRVYLNGESGHWTALDTPREERSVFGDAIATADFDGDGRLEALIGSNVFNSQRVYLDQGPMGVPMPVAIPEVRRMGYVTAVAAGDVDGDDRQDAIVAFVTRETDMWRSGIQVLFRRGESWESRLLIVREGRHGWSALDTGDLDGDGALDLVGVNRQGETDVFLGDGAGFLVHELSPEVQAPTGGCNGYHVRLADLDGDGRDEIVQNFAGEVSPLFAPDRCPTGGAIRAWDPVAREPAD